MSILFTTACLCPTFEQYVPSRDVLSGMSCNPILTCNPVPRPSNIGRAVENEIEASSQQPPDFTTFDFSADPSWAMQSAFDINLGEFMLDSDMQFLNNYFRKDGLGPNAPTLAPG